ncbi:MULTISPECIES: hypothetical protein [unclassified Erwinia]|nr:MULTISPECIES: hypothetical protein [unclassified Erwinia]PIJ65784.1 hypothetical protein BK416_17710 [Erwinia sp. OLSSP12]PIJ48428.1 hypothetical protein BV501_17230 [Erwinia sp. OAMSP11]PIJ79093.1 hypothetical protein BLD47_15675 [Erwinia sp. OLCASP19]PIJ79561.1 hypothetical protein BLD46_16795 [Erwinia sp. OLMTSP26]PIJ81864.1 hypothetical protein BLD49_16030 [Erwinia sp. OLMDSP33]
MLSKELFDILGGENSDYHGVTFSLTKQNEIKKIINTPNLFGHDPSVNDYIPTGRNLISAIKDVISEAKHSVDISTLMPYPDGDFLRAIHDGIYQSYQKGNRPVIRVLGGWYYYSGSYSVNHCSRPVHLVKGFYNSKNVEWWPFPHLKPIEDMEDFIKALALPADLKVYVGAMQSDWGSWNHSKLIIVDGKECIAGGHNMYDATYLRFAPVHDLSVRLAGPAVQCAEHFLNRLWAEVARYADTWNPLKWYWSMFSYNDKIEHGVALVEIKNDAEITEENTEVLALGRLGSKIVEHPDNASNASQTVRIEAIKRVKNHVRLSQQMLGDSTYSNYDEELITVLSQLIVDGKQVSIIIGDKGGADQLLAIYSGDSIKDTAFYIAEKVKALLAGWDITAVRDLLANNLHVAPVRFFDKEGNKKYDDDWKWRSDDGQKIIEPGNHAKNYGDASNWLNLMYNAGF